MSETELARVLIETPIDQLIELIKQKKKVPLSKAATHLNVTENQIEAWVKVLEEKGFLRLMYPPIGEPYIVLGSISPDKLDHKMKEFEKKKKKIKDGVEEMEDRISEAEGKVEVTDQKFVKTQEDLYKNL